MQELLSKPTFAVLSAGLTEHWRSAVMRILSSELCIKTGLIEALTPTAKREQDCLTVPATASSRLLKRLEGAD